MQKAKHSRVKLGFSSGSVGKFAFNQVAALVTHHNNNNITVHSVQSVCSESG